MALVVIVKLCIGYYIKHHQDDNTGLRVANKSFSHNEKLHQHEGCSVKESIDHTSSFGKKKYVGISSRLLPMASLLDFPLMYYVTLYYIHIFKKKISVEPNLLL